MSDLFKNARIVNVTYNQDDSVEGQEPLETVTLFLETECPHHLTSQVTIPLEHYPNVDIPFWFHPGSDLTPESVLEAAKWEHWMDRRVPNPIVPPIRIIRNSNIEWLVMFQDGITHKVETGSLEHFMKDHVISVE